MNNYTEQAKRTCPYLGSDKLDLCHMVLGMNTEVIELKEAIVKEDIVNISEEVADICWYISNYFLFRQIPSNDLIYSYITFDSEYNYLKSKVNSNSTFLDYYLIVENPVQYLFSNISELQDLIKKNIAYNKSIDLQKELTYTKNIIRTCMSIAKRHKFSLDKALENNINKLKARFPDKFTEENAINRDLEAERKELEK